MRIISSFPLARRFAGLVVPLFARVREVFAGFGPQWNHPADAKRTAKCVASIDSSAGGFAMAALRLSGWSIFTVMHMP